MGSQTSLENLDKNKDNKNKTNNNDTNNNNENNNKNNNNNTTNNNKNTETKVFENLNYKKTFSEIFLKENTDSTEYYKNEAKNEDEENSEEEKEKNNKKYPIEFKWNKGGNIVYLTGSFCNWEKYYLMKKKNDGTFSLTLQLSKGNYQYKYKVDEQWKVDDEAKTINDKGNENNLIENEDFDKKIENENKRNENNNNENNENNENKNNENNENKNKNKENKDKNNIKKKEYGCFDVVKSDFNEKPSNLPYLFKHYFDMDHNTNQDNIGKSNFFANIKEKNVLNENGSFKEIYPLFHIHINHMHTKTLINQQNNKKFYLISMSLRIKHKITTIVYYSPKMNY